MRRRSLPTGFIGLASATHHSRRSLPPLSTKAMGVSSPNFRAALTGLIACGLRPIMSNGSSWDPQKKQRLGHLSLLIRTHRVSRIGFIARPRRSLALLGAFFVAVRRGNHNHI